MDKIKNFLGTIYLYLKVFVLTMLVVVTLWGVISPSTFMKVIPSLSWWSATLFSDYKVNSIITEVEASGYNIRKVQSIDAFGRVCTDTFANSGMATSCEYPPEERKNWTIEDYRKLAKVNR